MVHIENLYFQPDVITKNYVETGFKKTNLFVYQMLLLGILGGAFIAFAAQGSNAAIHTIESVGVAKALAGALFTTGLMMVIITGAELFTGNMLIVVSCLDGKSKWSGLMRNWFFVYAGNFIGSMLIVLFIILSGQFNFSDGLLGGFTIKTASYKVSLSFGNAFFMGLLCNCLVCMAVWMASAAKDISGKLLAVFFPIWLFITSGFEHSIANMYYIPAGILAKANPLWADAAISMGITQEMLDSLNWYSFLVKNLIPVTLGNIAGGTIFVGAIYWLSFLYKQKQSTDIKKSANIKEVVYDNQK
jgi:formate/nitrite transporter